MCRSGHVCQNVLTRIILSRIILARIILVRIILADAALGMAACGCRVEERHTAASLAPDIPCPITVAIGPASPDRACLLMEARSFLAMHGSSCRLLADHGPHCLAHRSRIAVAIGQVHGLPIERGTGRHQRYMGLVLLRELQDGLDILQIA